MVCFIGIGLLASALGLSAVWPRLQETLFVPPKNSALSPASLPSAETKAPLKASHWLAQSPLFLRLFKQEGELELWVQGQARWRLLKVFDICRWSGKLGPKFREGDFQAPEGFYLVGKKQLNPNSDYHLSFNLGFPNAVERAQGRTGSYLMIHGGCQSAGCYAMTDAAVEEIYRMVEGALAGGQEAVPVHAFPFRLTDRALAERKNEGNYEFWLTLKPFYDAFETTGFPPEVYACGGRYGLAPEAGCQQLEAW